MSEVLASQPHQAGDELNAANVEQFLAEIGLDDDFIAKYDAYLDEIDIDSKMSELRGVMSLKVADGTEKTYAQMQAETEAFFSDDTVIKNEALLNRMAMEFAMACLGHNHGAQLANDEYLGSIFDKGIAGLTGLNDNHDHHDHTKTDKKNEKDKKRRRRYGSFLSSLLND